MQRLTLSWEPVPQSSILFAVHANFPLQAAGEELMKIAGLEQVIFPTRYQAYFQVGRHFDWTTIWPQVEAYLRWYGQEHLAQDAATVDGALRKVIEAEYSLPARTAFNPATVSLTMDRLRELYAEHLRNEPPRNSDLRGGLLFGRQIRIEPST